MCKALRFSAARNINTVLGSGARRRRGKVFSRPLSCGSHHHADPRAERDLVLSFQLEKAWRGPRGVGEHLARRSVFQWDRIPRLEGAAGSGVDVADPGNVRSADRPETDHVASGGRMEARRGDQRSRGAEPAAMTEWTQQSGRTPVQGPGRSGRSAGAAMELENRRRWRSAGRVPRETTATASTCCSSTTRSSSPARKARRTSSFTRSTRCTRTASRSC